MSTKQVYNTLNDDYSLKSGTSLSSHGNLLSCLPVEGYQVKANHGKVCRMFGNIWKSIFWTVDSTTEPLSKDMPYVYIASDHRVPKNSK